MNVVAFLEPFQQSELTVLILNSEGNLDRTSLQTLDKLSHRFGHRSWRFWGSHCRRQVPCWSLLRPASQAFGRCTVQGSSSQEANSRSAHREIAETSQDDSTTPAFRIRRLIHRSALDQGWVGPGWRGSFLRKVWTCLAQHCQKSELTPNVGAGGRAVGHIPDGIPTDFKLSYNQPATTTSIGSTVLRGMLCCTVRIQGISGNRYAN